MTRYAHTEPAFVYVDALGRHGVCKLQIAPLSRCTVVVCTELSANCGPSVTNAFEQLLPLVVDRFELALREIVWVEHDETRPHEWELVNWNIDGSGVCNVQWRQMTVLDWMELGLCRETMHNG